MGHLRPNDSIYTGFEELFGMKFSDEHSNAIKDEKRGGFGDAPTKFAQAFELKTDRFLKGALGLT